MNLRQLSKTRPATKFYIPYILNCFQTIKRFIFKILLNYKLKKKSFKDLLKSNKSFLNYFFRISFSSVSAPAEDEEVFAEDYDDRVDDEKSGKHSSLPKFSNEDLNSDKVAFLVFFWQLTEWFCFISMDVDIDRKV